MPGIETIEQANAISYVVRTLRPGWNHSAILRVLDSVRTREVSDTVMACFRAAQDPAAKAPTAIGFDQYWAKADAKPDSGKRLCGECLERKPLGHFPSPRPPFICQRCTGATEAP